MKQQKKKNPEEVKRELFINTLSQVKYAEKALSTWNNLYSAYDKVPSDITEAFHRVQQFFVHKELEAYRNLFMISTVFSDEDTVTAKRMALKRFLSKESQIMHLITPDGQLPGSWLAEDEDLLRSLINEIEKEAKKDRILKKNILKKNILNKRK